MRASHAPKKTEKRETDTLPNKGLLFFCCRETSRPEDGDITLQTEETVTTHEHPVHEVSLHG